MTNLNNADRAAQADKLMHEAMRLLAEGKSRAETAEILGIKTLRYLLRRARDAGYPIPPRDTDVVATKRAAEVLRLHKLDMTQRQISAELGISNGQVCRILTRARRDGIRPPMPRSKPLRHVPRTRERPMSDLNAAILVSLPPRALDAIRQATRDELRLFAPHVLEAARAMGVRV